jgi:hypothetical protein
MTKIYKPEGISSLLGFLDSLREKKVGFDLGQDRPDSVMVTFTLVGCRVEVDFFQDHIEFSYFTGDENVHDDWKIMQGLLDKHWSDD